MKTSYKARQTTLLTSGIAVVSATPVLLMSGDYYGAMVAFLIGSGILLLRDFLKVK